MEAKIRALIKQSMLEKNKNKTITYRSILETAQKTAKKTNVSVTDDMIVSAIKNEIKQLQDLLKFCKEGSDKFIETSEKISYCEMILPKMASETELMDYLNLNSVEKNMGTCMKALKSEFGANMDGRIASMVAKNYINS